MPSNVAHRIGIKTFLDGCSWSAKDGVRLRASVDNLHGLSANILAGTALFHSSAALHHRLVLKDNVHARLILWLSDERMGR